LTAYHARLPEKMIDDRTKILEIIRGQNHLTMALCKDGEPYLATVNYGFDEATDRFYFHCAQTGKKIDYLMANPIVWGQVLQDDGYTDGRCDHTYHTVQFRGRVTMLEAYEEKEAALGLMIEQLESDPQPLKERLLRENRINNVGVGCIQIEFFTAKANLPKM
jgi:nitroimidazol reductase NimA-like FMN-containing flavoprotein (pyridoxamine 5'-phosphate oxidase superfamily)